MKQISQVGINLIKSFEGCQLKAYRCPANVLTIGWGHTGSDVVEGQVITQQQAEDLLVNELKRFVQGVNDSVKVNINQNQFDALVSFSYNCGLGALQGSTLLRLLNQGNYSGASDEFMKWNKASGKVLNGLTRRRMAERDLFIKSVPTPIVTTPAKPKIQYGVVTATKLNVRNLATTSGSTVIGTLNKGEKVKLDKKIGNWWSVYFGDHGGFVSAEYINVIK